MWKNINGDSAAIQPVLAPSITPQETWAKHAAGFQGQQITLEMLLQWQKCHFDAQNFLLFLKSEFYSI